MHPTDLITDLSDLATNDSDAMPEMEDGTIPYGEEDFAIEDLDLDTFLDSVGITD